MKNKSANVAVDMVKDATCIPYNFPQIDSKLAVWFIFEGKEFELDQFNISFGQNVDYKGQPQDEVRCGRILLKLTEAVPDNIYKWAMTSSMRDGAVEFRSGTSNNPLRIVFSNGFCVNLDRVVDPGTGLNTSLIVSAQEITINGINLENQWI